MVKFIKRSISIILTVFALLFLIPAFSSDSDIGTRIISGIIFCVGVLIALAIWGGTLPVVETPSSREVEIDASQAAAVELEKKAIDRIKQLKKDKRFFAYQRHLAGVPNVERKVRLDISLDDSGLIFYETREKKQVFNIPWEDLVSIETKDSQSSSEEADRNAFRVSLYAGRETSLGGVLLFEGIMGVFTKTPLIIKFKMDRNDQFVSMIVFDTLDNYRIAERIQSVRTELISSKIIKFSE